LNKRETIKDEEEEEEKRESKIGKRSVCVHCMTRRKLK
jgi:hypothetical protein